MSEDKLLYQVHFDSKLKTRDEVFSFIAEITCEAEDKAEVIRQLEEREQQGNTQIAEHIMLPHIESGRLRKSQIVFIHLKKPIPMWNSETTDIRLVICILLKENENEIIKERVTSFIRSLVDEEYLNRLLQTSEINNFENQIRKF